MQPFCNFIHWIHSLKNKIVAVPSPESGGSLKVSTIIFKTITMLIISTSKLRIRLCILWLSILDHGSSKEKKKTSFAHVWNTSEWRSLSETSSYSPRGFSKNGPSLCQIRVAVYLNVVTAYRLLLWTACFKYRVQSSLQRITIISIHTGNKTFGKEIFTEDENKRRNITSLVII